MNDCPILLAIANQQDCYAGVSLIETFMSTHQIELLPLSPETPSVLSVAASSPETSPSEPLSQAEPESLSFQVGDRVVHSNPKIEWD